MGVFVCFRLGMQARVSRDVYIGVCAWCVRAPGRILVPNAPRTRDVYTCVSLCAPAACTWDVGRVHTSVCAAPCWVHAGYMCTLGVRL